MNELALFAGVGGGILGGHLIGWRTICAVESDPYRRAVLAARQNDGTLAPFPIWDDVCTFNGAPWSGLIDVVSGGFPCQDISPAGKGAGLSGARSGLWHQMLRIIGEVQSEWVFVENSDRLIGRGLETVAGGLSEAGYDFRVGLLSAADCGAWHERNRCWIVGRKASNALRNGASKGSGGACQEAGNSKESKGRGKRDESRIDAYPDSHQCFGESIHAGPKRTEKTESGRLGMRQWPFEPRMAALVHGFPGRVDEVKALGNAQVPRVAAAAFTILSRFSL